jgi:hypothetical protein
MAGATEATIISYGLENPAQAIAYTILEAYATPGYVVKVHTVSGQMTGTNAITDIPDGYIIKSTVPATMQAIVNSVEGDAQTLQFIGVQALIPGQIAYLQLAAATVAVAIGDLLGPTVTQGCVSPRSATGVRGAGIAIAKALEAKDAAAGGTIRCRIIPTMYFGAGLP